MNTGLVVVVQTAVGLGPGIVTATPRREECELEATGYNHAALIELIQNEMNAIFDL